MNADPLKALFQLFEDGLPDGRVLFLNGVLHESLPPAGKDGSHGPDIQQYSRPEAVRLENAGYAVTPDIPSGPYDLILLAAPKNHVEARYLMARALNILSPGGALACAAANDAGGRRLKADYLAAGLTPAELSAHKSRAVRARANGCSMPEWVADGRMQIIPAAGLLSQPGLFGWNKIDAGSALLARTVPGLPDGGMAADFGCGNGWLSDTLLATGWTPDALFALDADARAVSACRDNLSRHGVRIETRWTDLTVAQKDLPPLDRIIMNPPFHEGKTTDSAIGTAFIRTAAAALKPGGELWMVANARLPYEAVLERSFSKCEKITEEQGFKVFHATK